MKKFAAIALTAVLALVAGCSSMGGGNMDRSWTPQANSTDNVRF